MTSSNAIDKAVYLPKRLKLPDFVAAQNQLKSHLSPTPLRFSRYLSRQTGGQVWLKLETLQPTGSFKVRGALHKLIQLDQAGQRPRLVTASAGNHGLGLALAASRLNFSDTTIFVPQTTPQAKLEKLRLYPVTLHQTGQTYEAAHQAAEAFVAETGAHYLPAYDDLEVIIGQGTCGLEIALAMPQADAVLVPTGGGGLISGLALAVKGINPLTKIYGLQPQASPAAKQSLIQKQPLDPYDHQPTIADGLAGGFGAIPFYLASVLIEDVLLFSETEIRQAIFSLMHHEQLVVEASGAIAIAPLLHQPNRFAGQTIVCVLTGANIDTSLLSQILQEYKNND